MKATFRFIAAMLLAGAVAPTGVTWAQSYADEQAPPRTRRPVVYEEDYGDEYAPAPRPARPPVAKRPPARTAPRTWEPAQPRPVPGDNRFGVQRAGYSDAPGAYYNRRTTGGSQRAGRPTASRVVYQVDEQPFDLPVNPPPADEPVYEPVPRRAAPPQSPSNSLPPPRRAAPSNPPQRASSPAPVMEGQGSFYDDSFGYEGGFDDGSGFDQFDDFAGGCCDPCGAPCRGPMYVRGEYLLWWLTGDSLPPLVTTSPNSTPAATAGVLGQSTTSNLFGGEPVNNTGRSGARIAAGWWFSPTERIEAEVFGLGGQTSGYEKASNGDMIIARPFFNLATGANASELLSYPGEFSGGINIRETSNFVGAGLHFLRAVSYDVSPAGFKRRFDLLYGFRYLGLYENLTADTNVSAGGASLYQSDGFKTSNSFYGGNIGASMEASRGRWTLLTIGRLGLGGTSERVTISGRSVATSGSSTPVTTSGGLLAMPTNIGTYGNVGFAVVPQLETKLTFVLTPSIRLNVGYDIMYWSRVARPGQQLSPYVNPTQSQGRTLTGTPGPVFGFRETSLLVQGLSTGLEFRF